MQANDHKAINKQICNKHHDVTHTHTHIHMVTEHCKTGLMVSFPAFVFGFALLARSGGRDVELLVSIFLARVTKPSPTQHP